MSGGPFSRSITDPASTTLATGFCLFISVIPEYTNAEAKAFAAFLVAKDDFRRTASVMPQPLSPCASDINHPDTCPKKNLIELTKPRISSASLGSWMPDGLILISIFCPAKGRIASTNDFAALPKSFSLGPSKSNWFCRSLAAVSAREAALAAASAEALAVPATLVRSAISCSAIVWRYVENRKIPPSANSSPATPIITSISNIFTCFFQRSDLAYSPMSPAVRTMPNNSKAISEISRAVDVADLDSAKRVPISMYELCGTLGFMLQGLAFACLLYQRLRKRRKRR